MKTCRTFFFHADGSPEIAIEWHRGRCIGRFDTCEIGDADYDEGQQYEFHVGYGHTREYTCVAVDKTAALLQRTQ